MDTEQSKTDTTVFKLRHGTGFTGQDERIEGNQPEIMDCEARWDMV